MGRKVLVAQFVTESNANIPYKTDLENYDLRFGEDAISQMNMGTVFADAGIEVVPSVYANGFSGGVVTRNAFDYIENRLLNDIRANLGTLDGMFLHLHVPFLSTFASGPESFFRLARDCSAFTV